MGSVKRTVFEATSQLLESRAHLWALGEQERVSNAAMFNRAGNKVDEDPSPQREKAWGSQPKRDGTKPDSLPCECLTGMVAYVHQMYGFFGDGILKPEVFQESVRRWQQVAINMGAWYHEWAPSQVETLIRKQYTKYWQMYVDCR